MKKKTYDAIIIGAGAAGLTAGIYLSRGKASVLILDTAIPGGQMILTHQVANYPGVPSTSGYALSQTMKEQAVSFGCEVESNVSISNMILDADHKQIEVNNDSVYTSKVVIIASGGRSRMLQVAGENELKGRGISYCATCDGDFFQDKEIAVVGGGNSALEEAVSLTRYACKVTIIHEFDHFQAFDHAVEAAKANDKINFIMDTHITSFKGKDSLESIEYKNLKTGETQSMALDGCFVFIGYQPNTEFLKRTGVELNSRDEIMTDEDLQTNIPGVLAAGDCRMKKVRQITTAVADGTISGMKALEIIHR